MSRPNQTGVSIVETIRCVYTPQFAFTERRPPGRAVTSLEEERSELLDSLLQVLKSAQPDVDSMAVCICLLRHMAKTARRT